MEEVELRESGLCAGCGYLRHCCLDVKQAQGEMRKRSKVPPLLLISRGPQGAKDPEARKRTEGNDSEAVSE